MNCLRRNNLDFLKIVKQSALAGCFMFFIGCSPFEVEADPSEHELAKVGVYTLYLSDVLENIDLTSEKDSASMVKIYINNWVKSHVLLQKAETELYAEEKKFSKQLEEYRNSLLRYAYEKKYIDEHLDTNVSNEEILKFYNDNQKNFELKEDVVRLRYALVDKTKNALKSKAKSLLLAKGPKAEKDFDIFCKKNKVQGYWQDSSWVLFEDVKRLIALDVENNGEFLREHSYYEKTDSVNVCLVSFTNYKMKDAISPLNFEKEKIRRIILNQRKIKLVEEMEKRIYDEAVADGEVEEY